jgi:hypothetical protein
MGKVIGKRKKAARAVKPEPTKKGNVFDAFVKQMFRRIFVFVDFLLHYADPEFVDAIDLKKISPAPTHYIGKDGAERIADLIFHCPLKNGNGSLMAVIIFEHQGGSLKKIPQKLHKYISGIWDAEDKAGRKILSAPYFIVLRTGKKPHRGPYPKMADRLPKKQDGKPLGHIPEIKYTVIDLPAWNFKNFVGGPVLRLVLGILQTMTVGDEDNLPAAFLPLGEVPDDGRRVELTQEFLDFVANAMAAHNRRLNETMMSRILKPIFNDKERTMIKTIFDEKYDEGVAVGEARSEAKVAKAKAEAVLAVLRAKFKRIPKETEKAVYQMTDPIALDSLVVHAAQSKSLTEFAEALQ